MQIPYLRSRSHPDVSKNSFESMKEQEKALNGVVPMSSSPRANSALVSDACASALRASYSAPQRER